MTNEPTGPLSTSVTPKTLRSLASKLENGELTSVALVEEGLSNASQADPSIFTQRYDNAARDLAAKIDENRLAGHEDRQFAGIPITIKDLFDLAGTETWAGSKALQGGGPASVTAPAIQKLLDAGLVVLGKTNMTEFAYSGLGINPHFGTPRNPADPEVHRIPGGSSAGSAASVACGIVSASVGTDTGGSVRIPSALCGLYGLKPTTSSISNVGVIPLAVSLDSVGPLTNSVQCCSDLHALMSGHQPELIQGADLQSLRLLVPTNVVWDHCDPETKVAMDQSLIALERAGATVVRQELSLLDQILQSGVQGVIAGYESWQWHKELLSKHGDLYDPRVRVRIEGGGAIATKDYESALQIREQLKQLFKDLMGSWNAVVYPTTAIAAPPVSSFDNDERYSELNQLMLRNTAIGNVLDATAVTIPLPVNAREHRSGKIVLPVGLMLMAGAQQEGQLLSIAETVDSVVSFQHHS